MMVNKNEGRNPEKTRVYSSLSKAIKQAYRNGEEDERLEPIIVVDEDDHPLGRFQKGDLVIFYDIRGEREIELTRSFLDKEFDEFPVDKGLELKFTTMIEYHKDLKVNVAFSPKKKIEDTLCHALSAHGLRYIKIVESEKAVHLGYFFNGKSNDVLPGEEKQIIPSLKVAIPDERPKMRIREVTNAIRSKLMDEEMKVIIANLANVDVVGHTENEAAIIDAVECVDEAVGKIIEAAKEKGVTVIITADHGTVEKWLYPDGSIDTGHTTSPVPFMIVESEDALLQKLVLRVKGELADVAPTILEILGIDKPESLTGKTLLVENPYKNNARKRLLLLILDGWGASDEKKGNLIYKASTPILDNLKELFPSIRLEASGEVVGLPEGSVGNSEVGHLHLGAGRRILSDRLRIDNAVADGTFFQNTAILEAMQKAKANDAALHLLGIVSFYSSHGSVEHLKALIKLAEAQGVKKVFIHGILGRRGEKPESGARYIHEIEEFTKKLNTGKIVTVIGRHWVLDREENWDRVKKAYDCLVYGKGSKVLVE